jgi:hypothetical protein
MPKVKVGKETVKFLALSPPEESAFTPYPRARRFRANSWNSCLFVYSHGQNFLAPPYGCAIVPRILGNWILNEMDNHGT